MHRLMPAFLLVCSLAAASASAQSPGPTDPAGPHLEPPTSPRIGTEITEPVMDEQIERGTLMDRTDAVEGKSATPDTHPQNSVPIQQPARPSEPR